MARVAQAQDPHPATKRAGHCNSAITLRSFYPISRAQTTSGDQYPPRYKPSRAAGHDWICIAPESDEIPEGSVALQRKPAPSDGRRILARE
jgi:hypothetical protein